MLIFPIALKSSVLIAGKQLTPIQGRLFEFPRMEGDIYPLSLCISLNILRQMAHRMIYCRSPK